MLSQMKKTNTFFKIADSATISFPAPKNISHLYDFGSMSGLCLMIQVITGFLLAIVYVPSMDMSYYLLFKTMENLDNGWMIRYLHFNGASFFFITIFLHTGRGLYYNSYSFKNAWMSGTTILILTMAAAFMGYVLPMNQMSFWGASVITNLFTEVPYIGQNIVKIIWGNMSVSEPTIVRFFSLHFIIPFIIMFMVVVHITLLHSTGGSNPLGVNSNKNKKMFHKYFSYKDFFALSLAMLMFLLLCLMNPLMLGDNENFKMAMPLVTPHHIQPEWYFLMPYAILRSIPNKLGGAIALLASIMILYTLPISLLSKSKSNIHTPMNKMMFWYFIITIIILTWIGMCPVEFPYILTGQIFTFMYFIWFITKPLSIFIWEKFMKV